MTYTNAANNALFDLVVEEGCEIGVARSKLRRSGPDFRPFSDPRQKPYRPGEPTNLEAFNAEVFDILTLIDLMFDRGLISQVDYARHRVSKMEKLRRWAPEIFEESK